MAVVMQIIKLFGQIHNCLFKHESQYNKHLFEQDGSSGGEGKKEERRKEWREVRRRKNIREKENNLINEIRRKKEEPWSC